ncbi:glucose-6-phosphate isomerase [Desulfocucumis palustris]|uniref:glucose-6-phosphate isomerase n=1 Tax=Desulfocucumis palustris TaxID=1898651 RepID=A0A2L2XDN5_9FIRM|nr:glucose-6-phosphate isomerase [Desulfocucumis palustris]GBF34270.1 glucose-6-phosphate isomerase [Desulfocucumis palustris]
MTKLTFPFKVDIDFATGHVTAPAKVLTRRLSDLQGLFMDSAAYEQMLSRENPVLYDVYEIQVPEEAGHLASCTTVIYPGKVGKEYFFTKGHFHTIEETAEIYTCLRGEGYLLMMTRDGRSRAIKMTPGVSAYIPPYWAHRTLNCGGEPFVFYGVWPADAGHDYAAILDKGFKQRVMEVDGKPAVTE